MSTSKYVKTFFDVRFDVFLRLFLKKIKYKFLKEVHELIDFEIFTETLFENLKIRDEEGKQLLFCKNSLSTVGKVDQPFFEILKFFLTSYVQVQYYDFP